MKTTLKIMSVLSLAISVTICFLSFKTRGIDAKDLKGAWEYGAADKHTVMIVTDKVFSVVIYDGPGKKFVNSYGGTWSVQGNELALKIEWNAKEPAQVGAETSTGIKLIGNKLTVDVSNETWNRIDKGSNGELAGAWIITGNYANDKVSKRPAPFFPRRTMKVLSDTRFHWIAYNVQTKEFMNAGGGSYTSVNGKYTEHIEFFTKTPESIGKSVSFQYSFVDGDWRHKGEKSTGGPLDECWTKRETLEK